MRELLERIKKTIGGRHGGIYWCEGEYGKMSITILKFPRWFAEMCWDVETVIYFDSGKPVSMEITTYTGYDPRDMDILAELTPPSKWDNSPFIEHGMYEEMYDYYKLYLPPNHKMKEELLIVDLNEKNEFSKFKVKLTAEITLKSENEMWYILKKLSKKFGQQEWNKKQFGREKY